MKISGKLHNLSRNRGKLAECCVAGIGYNCGYSGHSPEKAKSPTPLRVRDLKLAPAVGFEPTTYLTMVELPELGQS